MLGSFRGLFGNCGGAAGGGTSKTFKTLANSLPPGPWESRENPGNPWQNSPGGLGAPGNPWKNSRKSWKSLEKLPGAPGHLQNL